MPHIAAHQLTGLLALLCRQRPNLLAVASGSPVAVNCTSVGGWPATSTNVTLTALANDTTTGCVSIDSKTTNIPAPPSITIMKASNASFCASGQAATLEYQVKSSDGARVTVEARSIYCTPYTGTGESHNMHLLDVATGDVMTCTWESLQDCRHDAQHGGICNMQPHRSDVRLFLEHHTTHLVTTCLRHTHNSGRHTSRVAWHACTTRHPCIHGLQRWCPNSDFDGQRRPLLSPMSLAFVLLPLLMRLPLQ